MMRTIPLTETLGVWTQAPSAEAAARTLGILRRTLYNRVQSASPEELRQAITQIAAAYKSQLEAERQARMSERAAAQAQMKAVRKEGVRDRTRLEKRLDASDDALARALGELTIFNLTGAGMERTLKQPQRAIERGTLTPPLRSLAEDASSHGRCACYVGRGYVDDRRCKDGKGLRWCAGIINSAGNVWWLTRPSVEPMIM